MKGKNQSMFLWFIVMQSILYGFGNPLTKIAFESITAFWCLLFRFGFAFFLFILFFGKRIAAGIKRVNLMQYLPSSICMAVAYISCNLALENTTATNVGFLMSLPVVFTPFLSVIIMKKKLLFRHIPIQLMVVIGLYLLCSNGSQFRFGKGDMFAVITAIAIAGALVFGEKSLQQMDAVVLSSVQAGITAILSLICALFFEDIQVLSDVRPEAWAVVVYLAVGCTCIAYLLQNAALSHLSSQLVSMLQCTQPILTAVIAFFLLGEVLHPIGIVGAMIILICIVLENGMATLENKEVRGLQTSGQSLPDNES
ncbi:MAG: DMT family transporter [Lachnospiraceae bacterium]